MDSELPMVSVLGEVQGSYPVMSAAFTDLARFGSSCDPLGTACADRVNGLPKRAITTAATVTVLLPRSVVIVESPPGTQGYSPAPHCVKAISAYVRYLSRGHAAIHR